MSILSAPTFQPTVAEFEQPLRFIAQLAESSINTGVIKIVPPLATSASKLSEVTALLRSSGCTFWSRRQRISKPQWNSLKDAHGRFTWAARPKSLAAFQKLAKSTFVSAFPGNRKPDVDSIEVRSFKCSLG
jgi:hypothetical protein